MPNTFNFSTVLISPSNFTDEQETFIIKLGQRSFSLFVGAFRRILFFIVIFWGIIQVVIFFLLGGTIFIFRTLS